jgi:hypothetical protein
VPLTKRASEESDKLPHEMRIVFEALVADYSFLAVKHVGRPMSHPGILADLVRQGWRLMDEPMGIEGVLSAAKAGEAGK